MQKLIEQLEQISKEKNDLFKKEQELVGLIVKEDSKRMHAYLEIPDYRNGGEDFFSDLDSPMNRFGHKSGKSVILSIELPEHHINIVTPFNITKNKDNYFISCDKEDLGWIGLWTGGLPIENIIELNNSKEGQILTKFLATRSNLTKYLSSDHSENISISEFITKNLELSKEKLDTLFTNQNIFSDNKVYKGKNILIDEDFKKNLYEKMTLLTNSLTNSIENKNFESFEEEFEVDDVNSLVQIVSQFEIIRHKSQLDKDLKTNLSKPIRNKI